MLDDAEYSKPVDRHKFWFQYITTPTSDTPGTTILLHFDSRRYIFGRFAEGTQRACNERGVSLSKTRSLFLTGETKWENNGGILGTVLTMADAIEGTDVAEKKTLGEIMIYGGPKIWHTIAAARRFIFRTTTPMQVFEAQPRVWKASEAADFRDENIRVWALPVTGNSAFKNPEATDEHQKTESTTIENEQALRQKTIHDMFDSDWRRDRLYDVAFKDANLPAVIWLRDPKTKELASNYCQTMQDAPHIAPDQIVQVRLPWPAALVTQLPSAGNLPCSISMSYIIKGRSQRGKFLPEKAKAAGVPAGPDFKALAAWKSVTLPDGRVVNPDQVMEEPSPGHGVAILDIPNAQYLPDLVQKLQEMEKIGVLSDIDIFMWTLDAGISTSDIFKDIKGSWPHVKHIISSPETCPDYTAMQSAAASAARLNQIHPQVFSTPISKAAHDNQSVENATEIKADRGLRVKIAPFFEMDKSEIPEDIDLEARAKDIEADTRALIPEPSKDGSSPSSFYDDVSITTLGTGSAMPSKYRNVSSNLLHIPTLGYFLFDAGEGTLGQLKRLYNESQLEDLLCNLHMIWISHLHADHHLGTMSLLLARKDAVENRRREGVQDNHNLYVISEENLADYLHDYSSVQTSGAILLRCLESKVSDLNHNSIDLATTTLPISKLDTCKVSHCQRAQGIAVTFSNGFKIAYSGDCRPSHSLVKIGQDADVLIHEATFDDGMEGDAIAKKHSTIGEALGVAHGMSAKNVILTHFSQRYQKLPTLSHVQQNHTVREDVDDEEIQQQLTRNPPKFKRETSLQEAAKEMPICVAFDLMKVTIPQIKEMYRYYPAIESMFEHEQAKSDKRRHDLHMAGNAYVEAKKQKTLQHESKKRKNKGGQKAGQNGNTQSEKNINHAAPQASQLEVNTIREMTQKKETTTQRLPSKEKRGASSSRGGDEKRPRNVSEND